MRPRSGLALNHGITVLNQPWHHRRGLPRGGGRRAHQPRQGAVRRRARRTHRAAHRLPRGHGWPSSSPRRSAPHLVARVATARPAYDAIAADQSSPGCVSSAMPGDTRVSSGLTSSSSPSSSSSSTSMSSRSMSIDSWLSLLSVPSGGCDARHFGAVGLHTGEVQRHAGGFVLGGHERLGGRRERTADRVEGALHLLFGRVPRVHLLGADLHEAIEALELTGVEVLHQSLVPVRVHGLPGPCQPRLAQHLRPFDHRSAQQLGRGERPGLEGDVDLGRVLPGRRRNRVGHGRAVRIVPPERCGTGSDSGRSWRGQQAVSCDDAPPAELG